MLCHYIKIYVTHLQKYVKTSLVQNFDSHLTINNMKKILISLLFVLVSAVCANAQLLYRVSGADLKKPSYVFGTFHFANSPFVDQVAGVRQALDATDQVYGELNFDVMLNPDSMQVMQKHMLLPEGKTLKTVLTPEQYKKLDAVLVDYMGVGLSNPMVAQQMGKMSPATLLTQLMVLQYLKAHMGEFDPTNLIDQYFQKQAKQNNEPVGGLETLSFQASLLYGAPLKRQIQQLDCFLNNLDYYAQLTERMAKAYYAQDVKALLDLMNEKFNTTCDSTPEEMAQLLDNRNLDWASRMPAIMKAAPTLFVVGAGHLPGSKGVLKLLQAKGYTVEAVKP